jgi:hypothetical protein
MFTVLTEEAEIHKARELLINGIYGDTRGVNCVLGYQGGNDRGDVHWRSELDFWAYLQEERPGETRYWNPLGYKQTAPQANKSLSITVEINMPYKGIRKDYGGRFISDGKGRLYIAHSGQVNVGGGGGGKKAFYQKCRDRVRYEYATWPNGDRENVIIVGELGSPTLVSQVADFVKVVYDFKNEVKRLQRQR